MAKRIWLNQGYQGCRGYQDYLDYQDYQYYQDYLDFLHYLDYYIRKTCPTPSPHEKHIQCTIIAGTLPHIFLYN